MCTPTWRRCDRDPAPEWLRIQQLSPPATLPWVRIRPPPPGTAVGAGAQRGSALLGLRWEREISQLGLLGAAVTQRLRVLCFCDVKSDSAAI